ncbi:unnamed protein product [Euphydryas editha]|uniref:Uncharacterized protein n=1 Tax=Euphydryas editha TaxID=104508 RepID=A0AAU9TEF5_EUPED|nr:unnamed protein product [Euphydryas editha]
MSPYAECDSLSRFGREFKRQLLNIQWRRAHASGDLYRAHNTAAGRHDDGSRNMDAPARMPSCFMLMQP